MPTARCHDVCRVRLAMRYVQMVARRSPRVTHHLIDFLQGCQLALRQPKGFARDCVLRPHCDRPVHLFAYAGAFHPPGRSPLPFRILFAHRTQFNRRRQVRSLERCATREHSGSSISICSNAGQNSEVEEQTSLAAVATRWRTRAATARAPGAPARIPARGSRRALCRPLIQQPSAPLLGAADQRQLSNARRVWSGIHLTLSTAPDDRSYSRTPPRMKRVPNLRRCVPSTPTACGHL